MRWSGLIKSVVVALLFILFPFTPTWAYVGPGVGLNLLGAFWTVIAVLLAAFGGLLVWPVRSLRRWWRSRAGQSQKHNDDHP